MRETHPLVLIVDDDPSIHGLFGRIFAANGYAPQHAVNVAAAIHLAQILLLDVVVLDLALGANESGTDFLPWFRSQIHYGHTPVLVLTDGVEPTATQAALIEHYAAHLVHKPMRPSELLAYVNALAGTAAAPRLNSV